MLLEEEEEQEEEVLVCCCCGRFAEKEVAGANEVFSVSGEPFEAVCVLKRGFVEREEAIKAETSEVKEERGKRG